MRVCFPRKHGNTCLVLGSLLAVVCTWFVLFSLSGSALNHISEVSEKQILEHKVVELRERLEYSEMLHQQRQKEILRLQRELSVVIDGGNYSFFGTNISLPKLHISHEGSADLMLPSIYNHLPHLLKHPTSLQPAYRTSRGRMGVQLVIGIPTIARTVKSYLMDTLQSVLDSMSAEEKKITLVVVFIAEPNLNYVTNTAKQIEKGFKTHIDSGLLDIISPAESFYPDFRKLNDLLGDPPERVKWRTKQNLDFAYVMMYAQARGTYYLQLEDDIVAKPGYVTTIRNFILGQQSPDWFLLEFTQLGFIGKCFKAKDLGLLSEFFLMFHADKPVDWLLDHFFFVRLCRPDKDIQHCARMKARQRIRYKPSLFQHVGVHSSLKGKVQKLKDRDFGKIVLHKAHSNPPAAVFTTLKVYKHYTLEKAYAGDNFFWALLPQAGDFVRFDFVPPIKIKTYLLRSGNAEHMLDIFYNATVEVSPSSVQASDSQTDETKQQDFYPKTKDGFYIVGSFQNGVANGTISPNLRDINSLRIYVHSESQSWVILSEIHIEVIRDSIVSGLLKSL